MSDGLNEAVWSTAFVNDLPDSSFALILPGGEKDDEGKTTPRSLRKLPYKDADGKVDLPHLRNALARVDQVKGASASALANAKAKLNRAADEHLKTRQEEGMKENIAALVDHINAAMEQLGAAMQMIADLGAPEDDEPAPDAEPMPDEAGENEPAPKAEETSELAELGTPVVTLVEQETPENRRAPLDLDVGIIRVGPGNEKDNHYYTREMLERDGKAFEGLTMHVVDHREEQRSEQTDVSTVKEILGVQDFEDGAYLMARVSAYHPEFCEKTRNRAIAGLLNKLECSILATGQAKPGEIDGKEYNVVQAITEARFVDWVTRGGAGGHARAMAENDPEPEPEPETEEPTETETTEVDLQEDETPTMLAMPEKLTVLGETNLPAQSVVKLAEADYTTADALDEAITAEIERLKREGSGKPLGGDPKRQTAEIPRRSADEIKEAQHSTIDKYFGVRRK